MGVGQILEQYCANETPGYVKDCQPHDSHGSGRGAKQNKQAQEEAQFESGGPEDN